MMKTLRRASIAVAATSALTGALALAATPAQAASTDQYDRVRYMWCAPGSVDIEYVNAYGNYSEQNGIFFEQQDNGARCGFYDFTETEEYGGYVSAHIVDEDGGPVSCAIWIDGRLVSKSNDDSSYYSYASCY